MMVLSDIQSSTYITDLEILSLEGMPEHCPTHHRGPSLGLEPRVQSPVLALQLAPVGGFAESFVSEEDLRGHRM